MSYKLSKELQT